jgi:hypothetical protein
MVFDQVIVDCYITVRHNQFIVFLSFCSIDDFIRLRNIISAS